MSNPSKPERSVRRDPSERSMTRIIPSDSGKGAGVVPSAAQVDLRLSGVLFATLVLALVTSLGAGCGGKKDEDSPTVCAPGRSIACTGAENCDGHQVCLD